MSNVKYSNIKTDIVKNPKVSYVSYTFSHSA